MNPQSFDTLKEITNHLQDTYGGDGFDDITKHGFIHGSIKMVETKNEVIVSCLKQDPDVDNPIDDFGAIFKVFRSVDERDSFTKDLKNKLFFLVDKYEHSGVDYSVSGSKNYPDSRWDVSHGCAVYVPEPEIQSEYRKLIRKNPVDVVKAQFVESTNSILNTYSEWCNGETYYNTTVVYDKKGNTLEDDSCGGYIGYDYSEREQLSTLKTFVQNSAVKDLLENVIIDTKPAAEATSLGFKIDTKDLVSFKVAEVYDQTVVAATYSQEDKAIIYNEKNGKVTEAKFEQWQKNHNVTPEQFLEARMTSDIKEAIRANIEEPEKKKTMKM